MVLYILRHAIAEQRQAGRADETRALTDEGRDKLRQVMKRARRAGVDPALILSSPLKRAVETAEVAAGILGYQGGIIETPSLSPKATVEQTWAAIREHAGSDVMIVGHEPHLSHFVAYALAAPALKVDLKKSALVCVRFDRPGAKPHGTLECMLTPRLAR
jgi:phosphohistidine phosphatase